MSHGLLQTNPWVTVSCLKEDVYLFPFNLNFPTVVIGKTEGVDKDWHGHVSALTVGSEFRRLGLAESLMLRLEKNSELSVTEETIYDGYFVDLYVRQSNIAAIKMYKKLGYFIYQVIPGYYSADANFPDEAALDMRKPLRRDSKLLTSLRLAISKENEENLLKQVFEK